MKMALIGYNGFVGSNLSKQAHFDFLFNSSNIDTAVNETYDLVICAAPSAEKWKANMNPESDLKKINQLIDDIKNINTKYFIQISTIDVYKNPYNVNESTPIDTEGLHPYGKHRLILEEFVKSNFNKHLIIRLPALFGYGLKKNFIYDMLHNNYLDFTDKDSEFQFYFLDHLWNDINIAIKNSIELLNITSEPISANYVAMKCFGIDFQNKTKQPPVKYNVKSEYDYLYYGKNGYLYDKTTVLKELKNFVTTYR